MGRRCRICFTRGAYRSRYRKNSDIACEQSSETKSMAHKPKLSVFWASSCGGCEIAVVNLHEKIIELDANFDFVFCPCLLDTKKQDVEAMPDSSIAVTLFNGAIRT